MGKSEIGEWRQVLDDTAALLVRASKEIAARDAEIARLRNALIEARDAAHSVAHSEFDGVWDENDFAALTPLADAALQEQPNG